MSISMHTGEATAGCIGTEARMKYDVIGRNMRLASSVEGFTRGGQILVAEATLMHAGGDARRYRRLLAFGCGQGVSVIAFGRTSSSRHHTRSSNHTSDI